MAEPQETRKRILDAAERLFAEKGFDATSTSSIATLASVPKGLLFYYFPTKADLLRTLVSERLDVAPIDPSGLIEPGDPVRSLLNVSDELTRIEADSKVLRVIVWREQRTHPEVTLRLREHRRQVQSVIERVLRGSMLGPLTSRSLRTAAAAWLAILTMQPRIDHADPVASPAGLQSSASTESTVPDLRALAELICAGLGVAHPVPEA